MCDDIDIEEHDVLDNPTIKKIFPDLSIIKKEILKYYDETQLDNVHETIYQTDEVNNRHRSTDTALEFNEIDKRSIEPLSKPDVNLQEPIDNPILRSLISRPLIKTIHLPLTKEISSLRDTLQKEKKAEINEIVIQNAINNYELYQQHLTKKLDTVNAPQALQENIIILGSKPTKNTQSSKEVPLKQTIRNLKCLKIQLTDVNTFLMSCKRYCKGCLTLFPTCELFKAHTQCHAPNVVSIGKLNRQNLDQLSSKQYRCECGSTFVSIGNYKRHLKNIHKIKPSNYKAASKLDSKHSTNGTHECFHCDMLFPSQKDLIDHLYEVLDPTKSATKNSDLDKMVSLNVSDLKMGGITNEPIHDNTQTDISATREVKVNNNPVKRMKTTKLSVHESNTKKKKLDYDDNNSDCVMTKKYKCETCLEKFISQRNLDHHVDMLHKETVTKTIGCSDSDNQLPDKIYRCCVCSRYHIALKNYLRHMLICHNITYTGGEIKKVKFNPQCGFCTSKLSNLRTYNIHLGKYHKEELKSLKDANVKSGSFKAPFKRNSFACKSVLFKCKKCDVFFLTAHETMCHLEHIELLVNWKCLNCNRIFKKKDMKLHLQQHKETQKFDVFALSECELGRVLYKCLNCAVHFSERNYLYHYSICRIEDPNSSYCNICDILVNKVDMRIHNIEHKEKKLQPDDFTVIESDILPGESVKSAKDNSNYIRLKNKLNKDVASLGTIHDKIGCAFSFCDTCKCFVTFLGLSRRAHIEKTCANSIRVICKSCGLVLTSNLLKTHKLLHKTRKNMNLHSYIFYDLNTKKITRPQIPEFPQCDSCRVHFLRKAAVRQHECHKQDYSICDICQTKFTERAYNLHMDYHKYTIPKDINKHININDFKIRNNEGNVPEIDLVSNVEDTPNISPTKSFIYNCESCGITVDSYEKVVRHCQDHYDPRINQVCMLKCDLCSLQLDPEIFEAHKANHSKSITNRNSAINFDPFYFRYDNAFWKNHIFSYVSDEEISNILENSIFRYECRLKLEVIQSGASDFNLYKCEKCQVFVNPNALYVHAQNLCNKITRYSCSHCPFVFDCLSGKDEHERLHQNVNNLRSEIFEILLFNKKSHDIYHKFVFGAQDMFILYQCRNCNGVVDKFDRHQHICDLSKLKSCSNCGLLLYEKDFDLHFIRHEELDKFKTQHITIVMFGIKHSNENNTIRSSFTGSVQDFSFYKCKRCCLSSRRNKITTEHVCLLGNEKSICSKCDLYFSKLELTEHVNLHKNVYELNKCTMNVIEFKPASFVTSARDNEQIKESTREDEETVTNNTNSEKLFKCECGLHFLEKNNAEQHSKICNPKMKISRQSCFKCNLIFTPGELFNHLLQHHGDKKSQLNLVIADVKKKL